MGHVLEHTKPNPNKPVHTVFNEEPFFEEICIRSSDRKIMIKEVMIPI